MPSITFIWADGRSRTIQAQSGNSLMYAAVTHGIDGIEAECGGGMVCGTCHVHVDTAWMDRIGKAPPQEDNILDGVHDVTPCSRLACQITVADHLDGLIVTIPRSDG